MPRHFRTILYTIAALLMLAAAPVVSGQTSARPFTVVIDAGHGGRDAGALGVLTNEKSINLEVANRLAQLIAEYYAKADVRVVMTRDADYFVTLGDRSAIANKAGADLFVSIHANSLDKRNPKRKTIAGASVYTLGLSRSDDNFEVAKRENAVMMLEEDYSTTYQGFDPESDESYIIFEMDQNIHMDRSIRAAQAIQDELTGTAGREDRGVRQAPFAVLRNAAMPAVLVELDFISNPTQEKFMASREGRDRLALAILRGVDSYRYINDRDLGLTRPPLKPLPAGGTPLPSASAPADPDSVAAPAQAPQEPDNNAAEAVVYRIQFLTSPKPLAASSPQFKGLPDVGHYVHNNTYKYVSGTYSSREEAERALPKVKQKFKDAFIVAMRGDKRAD